MIRLTRQDSGTMDVVDNVAVGWVPLQAHLDEIFKVGVVTAAEEDLEDEAHLMCTRNSSAFVLFIEYLK